MNTNEQAPDSCPFCGAKGEGLYEGVARQYECGSWDWPKVPENGHPRESQSTKCAEAERERLTRERDESRAERDRLRVHCTISDQCLDEMYGIVSRYADISARVKHLESEWSGWPDLHREWFGDKYAAMQPWDAVRARIEDSEARVKRLEEAGDFMAYNENVDFDELVAAWEKAKEATP